MARHYKLPGLMTPAEKMARVAADAQTVARRALTRRSGTIVVQNEDGSKTVIGPGAGTDATGSPTGVAEWVGDTTPPGKPTGVSATSSWGTVYLKWDGTLEGGVPADFAYVAVAVGGTEAGRMSEAGVLALDGYEDGTVLDVAFTAWDAARDADGAPAPNASEPAEIQVAVVNEKTAIDGDVEEIRQQAQAAADKADSFQGQIADVTATVNGVEQDVDSLTTQVSGAVEDASQALAAASSAQQDLNGFKTTVSQTYETKADADAAIAQERLDRNSAIEQSATQILQQVSETYLDKETGESLATKTEVKQTADGIRSEVSETYQTKAGMSAYATNSSVQQTADSIRSEVATEYQTKDGMSSYATKSYVDQQDGSITSTVSEVQTTADSALTKATQVEQTASGLSVRLTQAEEDVDAAQTTANTARGEASDAAKTATNFLMFDSSGLCVGDQTAGSLGMNALVAASKISLRSGATELATFSPTLIELGKNSQSSRVQMCGMVGVMKALTDDDGYHCAVIGNEGQQAPASAIYTSSAKDATSSRGNDYPYLRIDNNPGGAGSLATLHADNINLESEDCSMSLDMIGQRTVRVAGPIKSGTVPANSYKDFVFDISGDGFVTGTLVAIPVISNPSATAVAYGNLTLNVTIRTRTSCTVRVHNASSRDCTPQIRLWCLCVGEACS